MLKINNLSVEIEGNSVIESLNLEVDNGIYVLMGPNGAGKSTLSRALAGDDSLKVSGKIILDDVDISNKTPEEKFNLGLFTGFQIPPEIIGVKVKDVLNKVTDRIGRKVDWSELLNIVGLPESMLDRDLNVGFSGGERKKLEILQLLAFSPKYAILDEPDSGVDIDTVRSIGNVLNEQRENMGILIITHTGNLLKFAKPDKVMVLMNGKIVRKGGPELVDEIEKKGYSRVVE